jgi:hypothetical protein
MGKDYNNSKSAKFNRLNRRTASNDQLHPKVKCILCFKDPKSNEETIKAKFTVSGRTEVSEIICGWKTGDYEANLVAPMNQMVTLDYLHWKNYKYKASLQGRSPPQEQEALVQISPLRYLKIVIPPFVYPSKVLCPQVLCVQYVVTVINVVVPR